MKKSTVVLFLFCLVYSEKNWAQETSDTTVYIDELKKIYMDSFALKWYVTEKLKYYFDDELKNTSETQGEFIALPFDNNGELLMIQSGTETDKSDISAMGFTVKMTALTDLYIVCRSMHFDKLEDHCTNINLVDKGYMNFSYKLSKKETTDLFESAYFEKEGEYPTDETLEDIIPLIDYELEYVFIKSYSP